MIGGGHNGLVAAAYLARSGLDTLVCERRDVPGGAAVSEHPFGPDYTVTSLSYVVSLLPPDLVRDLRLQQHGYYVYPQGPYFAPRADGRALRLPADPVGGTPRSPGSPAPTRTPTGPTRRTWRSWAGCSARCCTRSRRASARGGPPTCGGRPGCWPNCGELACVSRWI